MPKTKIHVWPQRIFEGELLEDTKTTTVVRIESVSTSHKHDWKKGDTIRFNKQLIIKQENEGATKVIAPKIK